MALGFTHTVTEMWQMAEYMILSPKRPLRNDHSLVARLIDHFANAARGANPVAPRTTTIPGGVTVSASPT